MKNVLDAKYCMYVNPKGKNGDWERDKDEIQKLKEMSWNKMCEINSHIIFYVNSIFTLIFFYLIFLYLCKMISKNW